MDIIESNISTDSDEFRENSASMQAQVDELKSRMAKVAEGGGERAVERHRSRGKLLARERIERLVDPGTPFLELSTLAAWGMYDDDAPSAGIVTGIGVVHGKEVMVWANDSTVKGGTYYPMTVKKDTHSHSRTRRLGWDWYPF